MVRLNQFLKAIKETFKYYPIYLKKDTKGGIIDKKLSLKMELDYRLKEIIYQYNMHKKRILYAKNKINFIPLTSQKYNYLGDKKIKHLEQLIFRFSKLQDTFTLILELKGKDIKPMSFNRLNRLEELGLQNG